MPGDATFIADSRGVAGIVLMGALCLSWPSFKGVMLFMRMASRDWLRARHMDMFLLAISESSRLYFELMNLD